MPLNERIGKAGTLIKAIAALLALLPGVAMLAGLVDIPPNIETLIKFTSFAVSIAVVMVVLLLTAQIEKMKQTLVAAIVAGCAISGGIMAVAYLTFARGHLVEVQNGENVQYHVIPISPSRQIRDLIEPYQGDYLEALETSVQSVELANAMERESVSATGVIVALLLLAQALVIAAVVLGAWKLTTADTKPRPRKRGPVAGR